MSRKKPAVLGDEKTTEAQTSLPGVVSAYAHGGMRGWRHHMEDAVVAEQITPALSCFAVFDGHGEDGHLVSRHFRERLPDMVSQHPQFASDPARAITEAVLEAEAVVIGWGNVDTSLSGSTAVIAALYEEGGSKRLATANVGDARILLVRDGKALQLSVDHVPDDEAERKRIDRGNPNLRQSLVKFTEGSWRVGGVLALSRAFGDSFLKESGRFEGIGEKNADYGSGFGLNAEPDCYIEQITAADSWVMLSSDGLFENPERGGGGGWTNQEIADFLTSQPADAEPETLAKELIAQAVAKGSTDDVTVQLLRL